MTTDQGFAGQESDVNRACSAFGLNTLNYRAFPNTGPAAAPAMPPTGAASMQRPSAPSHSTPSGPFVGAPTAANPPQPPHQTGLGMMPPLHGGGSTGASFSLLAQAIPAAASTPMGPIPAFSMASTVLRPLSSDRASTQAATAAPSAFGVAFGAAFNAAFGTGTTNLQTAPDFSSNFQRG
jgi:hypothetical protein